MRVLAKGELKYEDWIVGAEGPELMMLLFAPGARFLTGQALTTRLKSAP